MCSPRHPYLTLCCPALNCADYVFGARKFGGNAQAITKNRWVHHTSMLWGFQPHRIALLRHPSKTPEYREVGGWRGGEGRRVAGGPCCGGCGCGRWGGTQGGPPSPGM